MCLFSPSSSNQSSQSTSNSTCEKVTNLNTSGNSGVALTTGGNASLNITSSCASVVKAAIACDTALAGGSIRTIACLAKSLSLNLESDDTESNTATLGLAACLVKSDQKFASNSICQVSRLACQSDQAIACLAAKNQVANNTLLSAVTGSLTCLEKQNAAALAGIATANDTTQASQSTAFATTALKYGVIAVLGIGAIVAIYALSKRA
jgi:hypothetical protein